MEKIPKIILETCHNDICGHTHILFTKILIVNKFYLERISTPYTPNTHYYS
jgi:hypothetical protein